ncbi:MAG: signal peptidase I [Acidobacteriota bacterium]
MSETTPETAPESNAETPDPSAGTPTDERPGEKVSRWRSVWEWARPLLVLLVALSSFRSAVADWNDVPTGSMKPTILEGDRVFVNKVAYDLKFPFTTWHLAQWDDPERGDVVVLKSPENGRRLIKRVIGVPGDELELRRNRLYVNGEPALYEPIDEEIADRIDPDEDPFRRMMAWEGIGEERHPVMVTPALHTRRGDFGPVVVPESQYFMMGDNRDESRDSRAIGYVPRELILGRAVGVAFSLDREDFSFRSGRFFDALE